MISPAIFVFTESGDVIRVEAAPSISLNIIGPFAGDLSAFPIESNLVWQAAEKIARSMRRSGGCGDYPREKPPYRGWNRRRFG